MLFFPVPILPKFNALLEKWAVAPTQRADYKKWLRYFLDFCNKYSVPETRPDQVRLFIDKLREKKQTPRTINLHHFIIGTGHVKWEADR
jgi:hypothetical protein